MGVTVSMSIADFGVELGPLATCRASLEMSMERSAECQCSSLRIVQSPEGAQIGLSLPREACQRCTGTIAHTGAYYPKQNVRFDGPPKRIHSHRQSVIALLPPCGTAVCWVSDKRG